MWIWRELSEVWEINPEDVTRVISSLRPQIFDRKPVAQMWRRPVEKLFFKCALNDFLVGCGNQLWTQQWHQLLSWYGKQLPINTPSRHGDTLAFICSHVCVHLMNVSPIFALFLALFLSPLTPEGNMWLLSCQLLHSAHQQVTNFVCRLVQRGFFELFLWNIWLRVKPKQLQAENRVRKMLKLSVKVKGSAQLVITLCVFVYKRLLSHTLGHLIHCQFKNIDYSSFKSSDTKT